VTSLASDHLGEWGVDTLADLAAVKLAVVQGVRDGGWLVLHAGSPALVTAANNCRPAWQARGLQVVWFAEQTGVAEVVAQPGDGLAFAARGQLWWQPSATTPAVALLPETAVALGLAATARHNLDNALAAAAMALLQGVAVDLVRQTLRTFGTLPTDNPGRLSCWQLHGALVLLDFAHNPQGMQRIVQFAQAIVVRRRLLVFGQAGDRSLSDLRQLVDAAVPLAADGWLIKDTLHYLRGRKTGEVPEILRGCLVLAGIDPATIALYPEESSAVSAALQAVQSGDLLILLIHDDAAAATAQLQAAGAVPWSGPLPLAAAAGQG
jgi:UDP-N-acetylmuramyl tripeptide synthase